jgi:hypothetical protein
MNPDPRREEGQWTRIDVTPRVKAESREVFDSSVSVETLTPSGITSAWIRRARPFSGSGQSKARSDRAVSLSPFEISLRRSFRSITRVARRETDERARVRARSAADRGSPNSIFSKNLPNLEVDHPRPDDVDAGVGLSTIPGHSSEVLHNSAPLQLPFDRLQDLNVLLGVKRHDLDQLRP